MSIHATLFRMGSTNWLLRLILQKCRTAQCRFFTINRGAQNVAWVGGCVFGRLSWWESMRQCSFEKLARFEMAVFEFARGYTNSYRRPTSPFCLTNGQLLLAFFYLCSTLLYEWVQCDTFPSISGVSGQVRYQWASTDQNNNIYALN